jgi:hypothetical protein
MKLRGLLISITDLFCSLSPNFHIHLSVSDLYFQDRSASFATAKQADRSWEYINRSHIHECRNWERGRAVSLLEIPKSDFRYSASLLLLCLNFLYPLFRLHPIQYVNRIHCSLNTFKCNWSSVSV